uniref:Uncharacterized protein n=1 Tax=Chenopodium quinoa TaxID=63459 RepID=A0A803M6D1_CHEQI
MVFKKGDSSIGPRSSIRDQGSEFEDQSFEDEEHVTVWRRSRPKVEERRRGHAVHRGQAVHRGVIRRKDAPPRAPPAPLPPRSRKRPEVAIQRMTSEAEEEGFLSQGEIVKQKNLVVVTQQTYCCGKSANFMCKVGLVSDMLEVLSLDKDRRVIIERCGFGDLFKLKKMMLVPLFPAQWRCIFGIPTGRKNLPRRDSDGGLPLKEKMILVIKQLYGVKDKNGRSRMSVEKAAKLIVKMLVVTRKEQEDFMIRFLIVVLGRIEVWTGDKIKDGYEKDLKKTKDFGFLKEKLTPWLHRLEQLYSSGCRVVIRAPMERKAVDPVLSMSSLESEKSGVRDLIQIVAYQVQDDALKDAKAVVAGVKSIVAGVQSVGEKQAPSKGPKKGGVGDVDFSVVFGGNGTGKVGGLEDDLSIGNGGAVVQDTGEVPTKGGKRKSDRSVGKRPCRPSKKGLQIAKKGEVLTKEDRRIITYVLSWTPKMESNRAGTQYVRAATKMYTKECLLDKSGTSKEIGVKYCHALRDLPSRNIVVFVSVLMEEHWWCVVFHLKDEKIWLIDSINPEPAFTHDDALDELETVEIGRARVLLGDLLCSFNERRAEVHKLVEAWDKEKKGREGK